MKTPKTIPVRSGFKLVKVEAIVWIDEKLTGVEAIAAVGAAIAKFQPARNLGEGMSIEMLSNETPHG